MDKEEIFKYINLGKSKSISVDRRLISKYPGIMRNVIIRDDIILQVDFFDENALKLNEGEVTIYFYYEDYDKLFSAVEKYLGLELSQWQNYNSSDWYPSTGDICDFSQSWQNFKNDFANKSIELPQGYIKYSIGDMYWEGLERGEIKVDDSIEEIRKWLIRKMKEEDEMYDDA